LARHRGAARRPIVNPAQSVFAQHWAEATGEALVGPRYFPVQHPAGNLRVHMVGSSPRGGVAELEVLMKIAIATAKRELIIQNPYFIPDKRHRRAALRRRQAGSRRPHHGPRPAD